MKTNRQARYTEQSIMIHINSNQVYAKPHLSLDLPLRNRREDYLGFVVGQHARSPSPPPRLRGVRKLAIVIHQDLAKNDLHHSRGVVPSRAVVVISLKLQLHFGTVKDQTYQAILPVPHTWYVISTSVSFVGFFCITRSSFPDVLPLKLLTRLGSAKRNPLNCRASG